MINGLYPVIVVWKRLKVFGFKTPVMLPIPVYLDEQFTGVVSDEATNNISIAQQNVGGFQFQRLQSQEVTYTFRARKNNVVLTTIVALMNEIVNLIEDDAENETSENTSAEVKVRKPSYYISFYYDDVFVLKGFLKSFSKQNVENTDLIQCSMTITTTPVKQATVAGIEKKKNAIGYVARG